jgi:DNA modification methylase
MAIDNAPALDLAIEMIPIANFKPNPLNPRTHSARQLKAIERSIREFGFVAPVLVDKDNNLIAGHGRVEAARKSGMTNVPSVRVEHLSPAKIRALMVADNKLSDMSVFDEGLLIQNFKLLEVEGVSLDLESTGFTIGEIDVLLDTPASIEKPDPDDAPILSTHKNVINRVGDLWQLGEHRLACGNSLDPQVWSLLMEGQKAVMSISDVPYNIRIANNVSGLGKIKHQDFVMASGEMDRDEYTSFLEQALHMLAQHSKPGSLHFAFIDWKHLGEMQAAGDAAFSELKNVIVWDKGLGGGMGTLYRSAHELIFCWKYGRARHVNNVELGKWGRNRTNIWRYPGIKSFRHSDEGDLLALHSTPKPVRMIADAMLDVSKRGDLVVDAFLGSGTSTIAAERVGRRCYGIELDPKYADVVIARYEGHSGEQAIHCATGRTFADIAEERGAAAEAESADV